MLIIQKALRCQVIFINVSVSHIENCSIDAYFHGFSESFKKN